MNRIFVVALLATAAVAAWATPAILIDPGNPFIAKQTLLMRLGMWSFVAMIPIVLYWVYMVVPATIFDQKRSLMVKYTEMGNAFGIHLAHQNGEPVESHLIATTAATGDAWTLRALLRAGATPDDADANGASALALAVDRCGSSYRRQRRLAVEIIDALLAAGLPFDAVHRRRGGHDAVRAAEQVSAAVAATWRPSSRLRLFTWWTAVVAGADAGPMPPASQADVDRLLAEAADHTDSWGLRVMAAVSASAPVAA